MKNIINAIKDAAITANREADNQPDWDSKAFFTGKREAFEEALAIIESFVEGKDAKTINKALEELQEM